MGDESKKKLGEMVPICLKGHERALTELKFNYHGDLVFTSSKDTLPQVWYTSNGERLGSYKGHSGAVWSLDVTWDSKHLLTGSADSTARLWDVETGECLATVEHRAPVRSVAFAYGGKQFLTVVTNQVHQNPSLFVYDVEFDERGAKTHIAREIPLQCPSQRAVWGFMNQTLLVAGADGCVYVYDPSTGEMVEKLELHKGSVNDLKLTRDFAFFITASDDRSSLLVDTDTYKVMKRYEADMPINSACVSPLLDQIVLGGGQKAMGVTMTSTKIGHFNSSFYDLVFEHELAHVSGHFGPIHTISYSPDGRSFASGSEDGYVRLHHFPEWYFETQLLPHKVQAHPASKKARS